MTKDRCEPLTVLYANLQIIAQVLGAHSSAAYLGTLPDPSLGRQIDFLRMHVIKPTSMYITYLDSRYQLSEHVESGRSNSAATTDRIHIVCTRISGAGHTPTSVFAAVCPI